MPYVKRTTTRRRTVRKLIKKPMATNKKTNNKDTRFKQVNAYNVKPEPFPRVLLTRCKFADSGNITNSLIDTASARSYRANSIWDPDFTGFGTTVVGHSILANIYGRYLVLGCKVLLSFSDPLVDGCRVGYRLRTAGNGATNLSSLKGLQEQPLTYISGLNNTGSQKKNFSFYIKPWSLIGISKLEYMANSSLYTSVINNSPTIPAYFDIFMTNMAGSTTISYLIKIVYYVKFYDRQYLASTIVG